MFCVRSCHFDTLTLSYTGGLSDIIFVYWFEHIYIASPIALKLHFHKGRYQIHSKGWVSQLCAKYLGPPQNSEHGVKPTEIK